MLSIRISRAVRDHSGGDTAFDRKRTQMVALKRLSFEHFCDDKARERERAAFEREYHALSQLEHPHIIRVYDFGIDDQGGYYSMELLSGVSLKDTAPLDWRMACRLARGIASALALMHSRSLVHRDVTPLHIRRTAEGCCALAVLACTTSRYRTARKTSRSCGGSTNST